MVSFSTSDISNRLDLQWSLPAVDNNDFNTIPDFCGIHHGNTPDIASFYLVNWDTHPSMVNSKSYEVQMIAGDDKKLYCCPNVKCSIEIGAEVQVLTINSTENSIHNGSFKVVHVGQQISVLHC